MMEKLCKFRLAWKGIECNKITIKESDYCKEHSATSCGVCGEQATHQCAYLRHFICDFPLCDNCEGWNDRIKSSRGWKFLTHNHRKKKKGEN